MNCNKPYTAFNSTLIKVFSLLMLIGILGSCKKVEDDKEKRQVDYGNLAIGYSILVSKGNVLVSGYRADNDQYGTAYWINGEGAGQTEFIELLDSQSTFRKAVDEQYRKVYSYKDRVGKVMTFQFDQGSGAGKGKMFYYNDNSMVRMDNDSIGVLTSVSFHDDEPTFAGTLGNMSPDISGGLSYNPKSAFVWDGHSPLIELLVPERSKLFWGVSTIYSKGPDEFYVGGLCGFPMYWRNTNPVVLDERFGEIWQIVKPGLDVYAAGLINKHNSNSTGHTACYWKNGELIELEEDAQAYGIFIDGSDIYVSGAVGDVPARYKPCYWKNGVRVDLPML